MQKWWKQAITDQRLDPQEYERQTVRDFGGDGDPDLLIVVDKLLTGFDEPRNAVFYIDKPLKGHNLIQAVARVNRLHDAKRYGILVDYRGILTELDTAVRAYQDLETRTQGGFDVADIEGLYQAISTEYRRLPALNARLWAFFDGLASHDDPEQFRQRLSPRFVADDEGADYDERQKLRDDFSAVLTEFGLCLQTALSSRSFFEDAAFPDTLIDSYKRDLRFFSGLRRTARQDAMETVDYRIYEEQIRKLVDKQVIGREVRESSGAYVVHELGKREDPQTWSEEKTRNEADLIQTRLRKTIEQELASDPYAQKVFGELLREAIAEAEAMFDHPLKQYAVFKAFEQRLEARQIPSIPVALADNPHASAYYGAILLELGEDAMHAKSAAEATHLADLALTIDGVVRTAIAENSLNLHSIESQIRQTLLPPSSIWSGWTMPRPSWSRSCTSRALGSAARDTRSDRRRDGGDLRRAPHPLPDPAIRAKTHPTRGHPCGARWLRTAGCAAAGDRYSDQTRADPARTLDPPALGGDRTPPASRRSA